MDARQSSSHPIFVWDDGRPCQIFVEATSVRERPKLVRKIIKFGGDLVNAVRDAEILLAENNTKEALELLDAWRGDKIILSTRWVTACIDQDRLLGEEYQWGGYPLTRETLVQGLSVQADESEEDSVYEQIVRKPSRPKTKPSGGLRKSEPLPRPRMSNTSSGRNPLLATQEIEREKSHSPSSKSSHISESPGFAHVPIHQNPAPPFPSEPGPSSSQLSYIQANTQPNVFSSMFNTLLHSQQQQHVPLPPASLPQFGSFPQMSNPYAQFNPTQLQLLQQLMMSSQVVNTQTSELQQQPQLQQQSQQQLHLQQQPESQSTHVERSTPDDVMSSDTYLSPEDDESGPRASRKNKGKERARSESYSGEIQTAIRSKPMPSQDFDGGLFIDDWGLAKKFYIMVDLKNRKELLRIAKKHHGVIVSEMDQADYIVLNNRSNQYQQLLDLLPASKIALSPAWLEACDAQERVVEMAPFVIDFTSGVGLGAPRKRPSGHKATKVEAVDCESEEETTSPSKASITVTIPKQQRKGASPDTRRGSRSPSPPRNIVEFQQGRNIFTPEDREWFFEFLRFKLERDPDASMTSLMKVVAHKAPHHTVSSWANVWRKNWRDEMEELKKDIARLHQPTASPSKTQNQPSQPSPSTPITVSGRPRTPHQEDDEYVLQYPEGSSSPLRTPASLRPQTSGTPGSRAGAGATLLRSPSDIRFPRNSTTPGSHWPPPSSAPVSQTSTQASPARVMADSLKRKDSPVSLSRPTGASPGKKPKVQPEDVIDVDSYPS